VFQRTKHIKNSLSGTKSVERRGESAYDAKLQPDESAGCK
jgi:hypothetical protein